jgi:predicted RNA binding protein YcfA (HicA-like mRNA interferase family)
MKVREILELLRKDGWYHVVTRGSHRQFKHATKPGRVTVAGKPNDDLAPGTLNSILKQAGLKERS